MPVTWLIRWFEKIRRNRAKKKIINIFLSKIYLVDIYKFTDANAAIGTHAFVGDAIFSLSYDGIWWDVYAEIMKIYNSQTTICNIQLRSQDNKIINVSCYNEDNGRPIVASRTVTAHKVADAVVDYWIAEVVDS